MNYENMVTLKEKIGKFDAGILLDVAVGRGDFLKFALGSFKSWQSAVGIDVDKEALSAATKELADTSAIMVNGSAVSMPFIDHYFNTVIMSNSLHHIDSLPGLFSEINRVCKPKGIVIINEMLNEDFSDLHENYMLYHKLIADIDNQSGQFHREPYTLKEIMTIIKSFNVKIKDHFIHSEITTKDINKKEIEAMAERIKKKVALMYATDYYYFFKNKASDISRRLRKKGVHLPRHVALILQRQ